MNLAPHIDQTFLGADATEKEIKKLCRESVRYGFASVCVNPFWVKTCKRILKKTQVKVCTVVGFPLGANVSFVKAFEAERAVKDGADEIDIVINIGALKSGNYNEVRKDIASVVRVVKGRTVKLILETCYLTSGEIVQACRIASLAGVLFVKTSTGFGSGGAKVQDVKLIKKVLPPFMKVKASGGIKDYNTAIKLIKAGADRLGTSSGVKIVSEEKLRNKN
ncbi:MAG: deoxyribose-phosphate aldolase [Candidatus Aureabacteria bacterium]|nr:deoxyribose-phosphate aldolase [Candidatus Auribacterota bacterium]